jgi:hypothetical protein
MGAGLELTAAVELFKKKQQNCDSKRSWGIGKKQPLIFLNLSPIHNLLPVWVYRNFVLGIWNFIPRAEKVLTPAA